jgi:hypothetical protein
MLIPYVVSAAFVLALVTLCFVRPNAGRIFLGFFFIAMGAGVNGVFVLTNPQGYVDYVGRALWPLYGELGVRVISLSPVLFGLLLMVFEIAMGLLLLSRLQYVKIGLVGTMVFIIALAPLSTLQWLWLGLVVGQAYLLTKEFDTAFLDILRVGQCA